MLIKDTQVDSALNVSDRLVKNILWHGLRRIRGPSQISMPSC